MLTEDQIAAIPGQPDGIEDDSRDMPDPARAADRILAYVSNTGDGLYDVASDCPLYGRDLESLVRAYKKLSDQLSRSDADLRAVDARATGPWRAVLSDNLGFVHDDPDEGLREIFRENEDGKITVCCGTALPGEDGDRLSGTYDSADIFVEIDLMSFDEYEGALAAWKRAQAAADGLNRMAAARPSEGTGAAHD